ncbi:hypothetical protein BC941DRAFT_510260 [Chlamydoabsidia padenii]|nr:hypothetical protein BC941DRAFT_510260 [Chlamydoabsidia padenii]
MVPFLYQSYRIINLFGQAYCNTNTTSSTLVSTFLLENINNLNYRNVGHKCPSNSVHLQLGRCNLEQPTKHSVFTLQCLRHLQYGEQLLLEYLSFNSSTETQATKGVKWVWIIINCITWDSIFFPSNELVCSFIWNFMLSNIIFNRIGCIKTSDHNHQQQPRNMWRKKPAPQTLMNLQQSPFKSSPNCGSSSMANEMNCDNLNDDDND